MFIILHMGRVAFGICHFEDHCVKIFRKRFGDQYKDLIKNIKVHNVFLKNYLFADHVVLLVYVTNTYSTYSMHF